MIIMTCCFRQAPFSNVFSPHLNARLTFSNFSAAFKSGINVDGRPYFRNKSCVFKLPRRETYTFHSRHPNRKKKLLVVKLLQIASVSVYGCIICINVAVSSSGIYLQGLMRSAKQKIFSRNN